VLLVFEEVAKVGELTQEFVAEIIHKSDGSIVLDYNDSLLQSIEHSSVAISLLVGEFGLGHSLILDSVTDISESRNHYAREYNRNYQGDRGVVGDVPEDEVCLNYCVLHQAEHPKS
jgi:hypothetical protein